MRRVVETWSDAGFVVRLLVLSVTGLAWAIRSLQEIAFHPDYWNPVTAADHFAVYAYSAAWLLTATSIVILREVAQPSAKISNVFLIVAGACAVTGVANGVEDGLGLRGFGMVYAIGVLTAVFGTLGLAAALLASRARRLAFVPAVGGVAMATMVIGGGVLGVMAWIGFGVIVARERQQARASSGLLQT